MMKNKRINFYIDSEIADKFKIGCIQNRIKMTEFLVNSIKKAIELGIYIDLSTNEKLKN